ncbi:MAG: response regulator transcription factor [Nocardioides sp.]
MLADDSVLFREGMARIMGEAGLEVVGQAGTGSELLALVRRDEPDVVVVDLRMPPTFTTEGMDAAASIRGTNGGVGILLLSQHVDTAHAVRLLEDFRTRVGYLLKDRVSDLEAFVADVRRVADGGCVIDPELVARLVARRRERDPLAALSDREREVLALMAQGRSNLAISVELVLSPKTVEAHVSSIFAKLGLRAGEGENRRVLAVLTFLQA